VPVEQHRIAEALAKRQELGLQPLMVWNAVALNAPVYVGNVRLGAWAVDRFVRKCAEWADFGVVGTRIKRDARSRFRSTTYRECVAKNSPQPSSAAKR